MKKKVCLYDYIYFGHHKNYIIYYTKALIKIGFEVVLIFPNTKTLKKEFNSTELQNIFFYEWHFLLKKPIKSIRFKAIYRWFELIYNLKKIKLDYDCIFIMWLDDFKFTDDHPYVLNSFMFILNNFFRKKWFGINIHQVHFRENLNLNSIKNKELILTHKKCIGLGIFDENIKNIVSQHVLVPVFILPDISNLKHSKNISKKNQIVLPGIAGKRKNVMNFVKTANISENENWKFIIAGKLVREDFSEKELELINSSLKNNKIIITGHIETDYELNNIIIESKLIYAVYEKFPHSSNIMTKSAAFNTPILVNNGFLMAERIKKYGFGLVLDEINIEKKLDNIYALTRQIKFESKKYLINHNNEYLETTLKKILTD